jgi:uracil-DNA glycosylase family 4
VFITNVVKCRPPKNRPPKGEEAAACHLYLAKQLRLIAPDIVCTLGNSSLRALVDPKGNITLVHGQVIEKDGIRFLPLYHPAALLYRRTLMPQMESDIKKLKHLAVVKHTGLDAFCETAEEDE